MMSVFAGIPRFSGSLAVKNCLIGYLAVSTFGLWAQQAPMTDAVCRDTTSVTSIGDELVLPSVGHVWARDNFGGVQKLVQLKYLPTDLDKQASSNTLKASVAPFIYKPKEYVELQGAAANVRLHDPNLTIYMRGYVMTPEDAAPSSETPMQMDLALVKLESKKDRRIISTIVFTQMTGKATRNNQTVAIAIEKVGNTDWQKITPKDALLPGEYALMFMPRGQDLFPTTVFDFAIEAKGAANPMMQTTAASSRKQSHGE